MSSTEEFESLLKETSLPDGLEDEESEKDDEEDDSSNSSESNENEKG